MKFMVWLLVAAVFALSSVVAFEFDQIAKSRSAARSQNLHTWHQVVCSIEAAVVASKTTPVAQKIGAVKFYDNLLSQIHAEPCGAVK